MAYIGRDTDKISNVEVLDNITFDGSSSYTLQKNSVNFTPSSANTLLVSIDGVVQAGNFTVSGSTIDFGTAVAGTSTCDFILHYGVGLITTPADGTVTEAKIGSGAVTSAKLSYPLTTFSSTGIDDNATSTAITIDSDGHVTKPSQPAVHAYSSSAQDNIATGVVTIQLDAEIYDVNSDFDTSTYTFTAPVTGKYLVTMNLVLSNTDTAFQWIYLLGVSSNRNYYLNQIDPRMLVQDGNWSWSGSSLVDMDANDTFIMKTRSSAHGAAQMDVAYGTANATETTMTITLLS
jgi:hypothetical protein